MTVSGLDPRKQGLAMLFTAIPWPRLPGRHRAYDVFLAVVGPPSDRQERLLDIRVLCDHAHHDAARPQPSRDCPRVDPGQTRYSMPGQILADRQFAFRVAWLFAVLSDHESPHLDVARLPVPPVDAVVADHRVRRDQDLAPVRRGGEQL